MKKINEVKSILTLNQTMIDKLSFERLSDEVYGCDDDGKIVFHHHTEQLEEFVYRISLGVSMSSEGKYDIKVQISGIFSISEESVIGKKILDNNTVAILFPYLRSQLTLLTSQPGFKPVILPVMNINALMSDEE